MITRNTNYKKQLKYSFIYKFLAIISSFLLVRYSLEFLGIDQYGLWSVILMFINWMIFFDFGIANGVKNHVAKSLAVNNHKEAQEYISTGYISLLIFSILIYLILFSISFFINWQMIFNTTILSNEYLQKTILITSFFILSNFVLSIVVAVYNATQNASFIVLNQFFSQFISLLIVYTLSLYANSSLIYIATGYGLSLIFTNIIISLWFYKKNPILVPLFKRFKKDKIKSILSLGTKFFILQMTVLIIMASDRMIAVQLLELKDVTVYDILFKYFTILSIFHGLINTPLWSMYTEAFKKKDFKWIKNIFKKLNLLFFFYCICAILMVAVGDDMILLWTGNENITIFLSNYVYMAILSLSLIWTTIYAYFLNGIEELNVQLISTVSGAIINIPLSIYFVKYVNMGLNGILLASILSLLLFNIAGSIQTHIIINKWNYND